MLRGRARVAGLSSSLSSLDSLERECDSESILLNLN
jgi:hypothetical protein